jgi:hypothetical protein
MTLRRDSSSSDPEKEARAHRKELRTSWRTGATEVEKITALRIALGGRKKKYSWLTEVRLLILSLFTNPKCIPHSFCAYGQKP